MKTLTVLFGYIKWHYSEAIISLLQIWRNLTVFIFDYFSIKLLFQNFFDPWKRMTETRPSFFDTAKFFSTLISNLIMRLVGIFLRIILIALGTICLLLFVLLLIPVLLIWLILPFIVIAMFCFGGYILLFK